MLPPGRAVRPRARRRQRPPAGRRAHRAPPRAGQRPGRAPRVLAPALLRRPLRDPHVQAARLRAGNALPAAPGGRRTGAPGAERGGRPRREPRAARPPAAAGRGPRLLRGAFLAAGSATGPRSAHFELRTADVDSARFLAELAAAEGFSLAVYERSGHAVAYAKGTETIADLLAFLGAQEAALRLGEEAVVAATRARANRLANADHANIVRTSRAADLQLRAIRRLEREGRLAELAPELGEIARLRVRHPTLSLRELARRCDPPATKAAAHRRLARIQRLAEL